MLCVHRFVFGVTVTECIDCPVSFWLVVGVTSPQASWEPKLEVLLLGHEPDQRIFWYHGRWG